jgi:uncharacterized short protein YbdD (DUF466 family)
MKTLQFDGLTSAQNGAKNMPRDVGAPKGGIFERVRGIRQICRQIFGIPDYERYLEHAAAHHPGAPVLSRRDFCAQAIERKYGTSGPRCC